MQPKKKKKEGQTSDLCTYLVDGVVWRPCLVQLLVQVEHGLGIRRQVSRAHLLLAVVENVHHPRHPLPEGAVVRGRPHVRARAQVVPCGDTQEQSPPMSNRRTSRTKRQRNLKMDNEPVKWPRSWPPGASQPP